MKEQLTKLSIEPEKVCLDIKQPYKDRKVIRREIITTGHGFALHPRYEKVIFFSSRKKSTQELWYKIENSLFPFWFFIRKLEGDDRVK